MDNCVLFANKDGESPTLLGMANTDAPKKKGTLSWCLLLNFLLEDETGMPTPDEHAALTDFQDKLEARVSAVTDIVWAAHLSSEGQRDAFFYVADPEPVAALMSQIVDSETRHPFRYELVHDPDWARVNGIFSQVLRPEPAEPSTGLFLPWFLERLRAWFR